MLIIKRKTVNDIPLLEIIDSQFDNQAAPLTIFYHGWTSNKDSAIGYGTEIAKRGFRVLIPEAVNHGERTVSNIDINKQSMLFFTTLEQNIKEFPQLVDYYDKRQLIQDQMLSVAGVSMGGMTSSMLLNRHAHIKSGVILMGTPQQDKFNNWVIDKASEEYPSLNKSSSNPDWAYIEESLAFMKENDLATNKKAINGRPLLFWHSKGDQVVPYQLTAEFVEEVQLRPEGTHTYLKLDEIGMHRVPYLEIVRMAEFLKASYQFDKDKIMETADQEIDKIFIHHQS